MKIWLCKEFDYLWLQGSVRLCLWAFEIINSTSTEGKALGICKWDLDWSISLFLWQQCFNDNQSGHGVTELPSPCHSRLALGTSSLLKAESFSTSENMLISQARTEFNSTEWHVSEWQWDMIKNKPEEVMGLKL